MSTDGKKVRVTVDMRPDLFDRLEKLAELTGASSKADVIRDAIQLYEYLATCQTDGLDFAMRKGDEWERVLLFRHLPRKSEGT